MGIPPFLEWLVKGNPVEGNDQGISPGSDPQNLNAIGGMALSHYIWD